MDYTTGSDMKSHLAELGQTSWVVRPELRAEDARSESRLSSNTIPRDASSLNFENHVKPYPSKSTQSVEDPRQELNLAPRNYLEFGMEEDEWERLKAKLTSDGREEQLTERFPCVACSLFNESQDLEKLSCGHEFCRRCLWKLIFFVLRKQRPYPAKCCQPLDLHEEVETLDDDIYYRYQEMMVELETKRRIYCADKKCSTFIAEQFVRNGIATCPNCGLETCQKCKQAIKSHLEKGKCPPNTEDNLVLTMAADEQWKRCKCGQLVEKEGGCDHMICGNCGTEFCYVCGALPHKCTCFGRTPDEMVFEDDSSRADEPSGDRASEENASNPGHVHNEPTGDSRHSALAPAIENTKHMTDISDAFERSDEFKIQPKVVDVPKSLNGGKSIDHEDTLTDLGGNIEAQSSSHVSAPMKEAQDDSNGYDVQTAPPNEDGKWWDYANNPRDLLPRTAEESDEASYVTSTIWYQVPLFDRFRRRRLSPEEIDLRYQQRLENEIEHAWVHVPSRKEIEREQRLEKDRERQSQRNRVKLRPRSVRAKLQRSSDA